MTDMFPVHEIRITKMSWPRDIKAEEKCLPTINFSTLNNTASYISQKWCLNGHTNALLCIVALNHEIIDCITKKSESFPPITQKNIHIQSYLHPQESVRECWRVHQGSLSSLTDSSVRQSGWKTHPPGRPPQKVR